MGLRRLITEFLWPPSSSIIRSWLPYSIKVFVKTNQTSPNSMGLRRLITEFLWPPSAPSSDPDKSVESYSREVALRMLPRRGLAYGRVCSFLLSKLKSPVDIHQNTSELNVKKSVVVCQKAAADTASDEDSSHGANNKSSVTEGAAGTPSNSNNENEVGSAKRAGAGGGGGWPFVHRSSPSKDVGSRISVHNSVNLCTAARNKDSSKSVAVPRQPYSKPIQLWRCAAPPADARHAALGAQAYRFK
ncbi:hypothetical protein EVAR_87016_1 [Eumeta japonica]|uniref:Uncharacterized protein n=1 Tax=Eumeta variegata TaxID=151549 RepID=A0A4C1W8D8_EUMVA|nr:hypothetical protein EVAR_87016_1 [Eumeta japonica]